jgi:hypothetical protein
MGKARLGGDEIGANPTDRGKNGSKKSILTDRQGGPLAIIVAGANVHNAKLLDKTIEAIVVERPKPTQAKPQHLCLDKGYVDPTGNAAVEKHSYTGHIRRIGEEKLSRGKKAPCSTMGCGKDIGMVIQMSRFVDPLREKSQKLSRSSSTRLRYAVVPQTGSKCLLR